LPSSIVYSDEKIVVFMDINPINPGHVLVIPKEHYATLSDLNPAIGGEIFKAAMRVVASIKKSDIKCEGVTLLLADGKAASQEVFHVHLHIIPRFYGDNFKVLGFNKNLNIKRETFDELSEKIRAGY
jgi:histidine triad (HIT) family protein